MLPAYRYVEKRTARRRRFESCSPLAEERQDPDNNPHAGKVGTLSQAPTDALALSKRGAL